MLIKFCRSLSVAILSIMTLPSAFASESRCSLGPPEGLEFPFFSHLVQTSFSIDLARVESVSVAPIERNPEDLWIGNGGRSLVTVGFNISESLKGNRSDGFEVELRDARPVDVWEAAEFDETGDDPNQRLHKDPWFWSYFSVYDTPLEPDCSIVYPPFQVGEEYLVLRNEDGSFRPLIPILGRNFVRIEDKENDAWLQAIRTLIEYSDLEFGRELPLSEFIASHEVSAALTINQCEEFEMREIKPFWGEFLFGDANDNDAWRVFRNENDLEDPDLIIPDFTREGIYWSTSASRNLFFNSDVLEEEVTCHPWNDRQERYEFGAEGCGDLDVSSCVPEEQYLLIPIGKVSINEGRSVQYYMDAGYPIDLETQLVDFTESYAEIELTGERVVPLNEVLVWFEDYR